MGALRRSDRMPRSAIGSSSPTTAPRADRVGSVDAVAHVGRMRDRRNLSGLERLTFEEARAYDAPRTRRRVPIGQADADAGSLVPSPVARAHGR